MIIATAVVFFFETWRSELPYGAGHETFWATDVWVSLKPFWDTQIYFVGFLFLCFLLSDLRTYTYIHTPHTYTLNNSITTLKIKRAVSCIVLVILKV